jgi:hypothetical protein
MSNPKNATWYGNDLGMFLVPGAGSTYFVDGLNGANTNDGMSADTPFLDITYALTQCTAGRNDYIFVIQYPADGSPPAGETYPIAVDKHRVHIIGGAYPGHVDSDKYAFLGANTDNEIFNIQAQWVEIAYLKLSGGATHAAIEFDGDGPTNKGFAIHHNVINQKYGTNGAPAYGIWMEQPYNAHGGNWGLIQDNFFGPMGTSNAIWINQNPVMLRIRNNTFLRNAGGIAINMDGPMSFCEITGNHFALTADTTGLAITFTANCYSSDVSYIANNYAHAGATQMVQNPYRDISSPPLTQDWGINYVGAAPTLPVTV